MSTSKRKHYTLSIKDKNTIIERLDRGESHSKLAREYGVGRATIYDINKNRAKIQAFVLATDAVPRERQTLKRAQNPEVEEALHLWFLQERRKRTPISGPLLASKAKYFYEQITGRSDFSASKGWLERFKRRHGIRLMTVTGERLSDDTWCAEEFKARFLQKVTDLGLCPSQVYTADESGLCWRVLPNETFVSRDDETSVPGRTVRKERITFLPCANASGLHTLNLLVIGKAPNPSAFGNVELPVHYYGQRGAQMTRDLFKKWFEDCFVPEVRKWLQENHLPPKALLLLDNAPCHPPEDELSSDDKSIVTMLLPSSRLGSILPMDQNVTLSVKQSYKRHLLTTAISKDQPIEKTLKEFSMKDLVFSLALSWHSLSASTIASSWTHLWPDVTSTSSSAEPRETTLTSSSAERQEATNQVCTSMLLESVAGEMQVSAEDLRQWYDGMDERESASRHLSEDEIVRSVRSATTEEEEDDDPPITVPNVSSGEAVKCFETCLRWVEENGYSSADILLLRRMRDEALISHFHKLKQEKA